MIISRLFLIISFLFILFGCDNSSAVLSPDKIDSVDAIISEINAVVSDIESGTYGETHSLLVFKDNKMISENYFETFPAAEVHYQYSVTKSFASALIGIAIDKGFIKNTDEKIIDFFPEYTNIQNLDQRKRNIKISDLLSMKAGFQWDEWTYSYNDLRNDAVKLIRSDDMVKYMLDLPMVNAPGERFVYNSGASMLLSGIIQKVSGISTEEFARIHLFEPLGIESWEWESGKDNHTNTGWGLHLLPKDMIKFGRLYLDHGKWNSDQIISKKWISESTSNKGNNYGYQWWLNGANESYSARGWGGQFIFVSPEHDMVVVTTAENFNSSDNPAGLIIFDRLLNALTN
jgi:CubicO group peptidase (beta-lactamase class C family)